MPNLPQGVLHTAQPVQREQLNVMCSLNSLNVNSFIPARYTVQLAAFALHELTFVPTGEAAVLN